MALHLLRIQHRSDGWHVVSEDGSRHLGGPYESKGEAVERLRQVEGHKASAAVPRVDQPERRASGAPSASWIGGREPGVVFSVNAWRFAATIGIGKWDRFTSWGDKLKDDEPIAFNEKTLGQIVDNFGARQNDIAMCYDHQSAYVESNGQPAPALAFYNALALVVDGKVTRFATHDDSVQPPDPDGLANGIYGYRSELTPLGEQLLPNYKYISPMFTDEGADEQGEPIGYDLMDVAATNTPFQDAVGLTFHKRAQTMASEIPGSFRGQMQIGQRVSVTRRNGKYYEGTIRDINLNWGQVLISWDDPGCYKPWVSFSEIGSTIKLMARTATATAAKETNMAKNAIKMDNAEFYKRLGLDEDASEKEAMAAMRALMKKMDEDSGVFKAAAEPETHSDPPDDKALDDDADKKLDDDPDKKSEDDDPDKKMDDAEAMDDSEALTKLSRDLGCKPTLSAVVQAVGVLKLSTSPKTDLAKMAKRMAELESKVRAHDAAKEKDDAVAFARRAIADGRWNPEDQASLVEARIGNRRIAERALSPKGTWTAMKRYTKGGDVIGKDHQDSEDFGGSDDQDEIGAGAAVAARKLMSENKGMTLAQAYDSVATSKPQLYRRAR